MTEQTIGNCRLCNYQSDKRLMANIFDDSAGNYSVKIETYLNLKIHQDDISTFICFHCSQQLDNFHNFASKIKNIQSIIYPQPVVDIAYEIQEIQLIPEGSVIIEPREVEVMIRTKSKGRNEISEKLFDDLKKNEPRKSNDENLQFAPFLEEERDETNEDWPPSESLKKIPSKLIENGLLLYKGKKLMQFMQLFYNTACEICSEKFNSINELFEHYQNSHKSEPFITCCSTKLTKIPRIIWHFAKHIQPEAFRCEICSYTVSRPKFLELHQQTHTNNKPYLCDLCDKRFIWKGALKSHLINHQPESERKSFICPVCNRKYQTAGGLASHKKATHSNNSVKSRNLCEVCSKSFATLTSYKEHLQTHSEDSEKLQLKCKECGKWLKNQRCLKSHLLLHNSVDYKCNECDYTTKKEKLLKNHIITRHTQDRPFACDHCDKTFKVKRALTIHKSQNHTPTSKNLGRTCEFCGREFASSTNYYTHRKNLHAVELQEMLEKKQEEEKLKRILIGLESTGGD